MSKLQHHAWRVHRLPSHRRTPNRPVTLHRGASSQDIKSALLLFAGSSDPIRSQVGLAALFGLRCEVTITCDEAGRFAEIQVDTLPRAAVSCWGPFEKSVMSGRIFKSGTLATEARNVVLAAAQTGDPGLRRTAFACLIRSPFPEAEPVLLGAVRGGGSSALSAVATEALVSYNSSSAKSALLSVLESPPPSHAERVYLKAAESVMRDSPLHPVVRDAIWTLFVPASGSPGSPRSLSSSLQGALAGIVVDALARSKDVELSSLVDQIAGIPERPDLRVAIACRVAKREMPGWTERIAAWQSSEPDPRSREAFEIVTRLLDDPGAAAAMRDTLKGDRTHLEQTRLALSMSKTVAERLRLEEEVRRLESHVSILVAALPDLESSD